MERVQVELDAPGFDRPGTVIRYGHWGRPVLVFPSEQGRAWDYENNGMVEAVAAADRRRPGQALLRGLLRRRHLVRRLDPARGAGPPARRVRRVDHRPRWSGGSARTAPGRPTPSSTGCSMGAYHALNFALTRADLFPLAICLSGQLRPRAVARVGGARRGGVLHQPHRLRAPPVTVDHLDWLRARRARRAHRRPGRLGGPPDRSAAVDAADGGSAGRAGHPARARRVGTRLRARLAVVAAPARRTTCQLLLSSPDGWTHVTRTHLIGLLLGAEEDWPQAFEAILRRVGPVTDADGRDARPRAASGSPSSRSTCTTRCAPSWSSTGSRTGTTTRASG